MRIRTRHSHRCSTGVGNLYRVLHGILSYHFAHGAFVWTFSGSPRAGFGEASASRAFVGAISPGCSLEVSGRAGGILDTSEEDTFGGSAAFVAHGAAVGPIAGAGRGAVAQGALVPISGTCLAVGAPSFGRDWGPEPMCVEDGGRIALGSRSQLKREPKGKCCTTGNFDRTSALYILIMP